ncbi:hypothetical protein Q8F55_000201 [Vanrija albida]|uniref:Uncharacterized protein n=1 Tax=Vanrija albida TaxID=181172 RepID=A0ABR3QDK9_9TREE
MTQLRSAVYIGQMGGIGAAIVAHFVDEGARVVGIGLVPGEVEAAGGVLFVTGSVAWVLSFTRVCADPSSPDTWDQAIAAAQAAWGAPKVLVNGAGVLIQQALAETTLATLDAELDVHVRGPLIGAPGTPRR